MEPHSRGRRAGKRIAGALVATQNKPAGIRTPRHRYILALGVAVLAAMISGAAAPSANAYAPARSETTVPPAYKGAWFGTTAAGDEISFTVNKKSRITVIAFSYEIEGEDCTFQVEDRVRRFLVIKNRAFKLTIQTKQETVTLKGRFSSKTRVSGTLRATYTDAQGCTGSITTTWTAKKGKKPVVGIYDGTWEGPVTLPPGLDPAITALADPTIEFKVENGKVTFVSAPWVIQGSGCQGALAGRILWDLDPPVTLSGMQLNVSFSSSAAGTKTWDVVGTFASASSASGTLRMAGPVGAFLGACTGSLEATWTATRSSG